MRTRLIPSALSLAAALTLTAAADDVARPVDRGLHENVEVNLVILDVQVLDRHGAPVPGLTAADFDLSIDRRHVALQSFDATCAEKAEPPALVFAFDYEHLDEIQRGRALESARKAIESRGPGGSEIMTAALTGGLRVEQSFTRDEARTLAALEGMRYDPSLFAGNFSHLSEAGFVRGLSALFDVAATNPKPKAILFYSAMRDVPLDDEFRNLAAMAAASRSVVYPVDVRGLDDDSERERAVIGADAGVPRKNGGAGLT